MTTGLVTSGMVSNRIFALWRRRILIAGFAGIALSYFGWHAFHGNYGLVARDQLTVRVAALEVELKAVREERQALERRVALLKPQSLDPDMLEERARATLMIAHPNDIVLVEQPQRTERPPTQNAQPRR